MSMQIIFSGTPYRPNNVLVKIMLFACGLIIASCTTELASQPSAPLLRVPVDSGLNAFIDVDMNSKISGQATESILLWFIPLERPTSFADGVLYSTDGNTAESLSTIWGSKTARLKAAAAYNAVYGKADIIVAPQWSYTVEDYFFFTKSIARVQGYAGMIQNIQDKKVLTNPKPLNVNRNIKRDASTPFDIDHLLSELPAKPISTEPDIGISKNGESGPKASVGDVVTYQYVCSLEDGTVVFDSRTRGQPRRRIAGGTEVPVGFSENLVGVRKGTHGDILIPSEKAFGKTGMPNLQIPPNAKIRIEYFVEDVIPS